MKLHLRFLRILTKLRILKPTYLWYTFFFLWWLNLGIFEDFNQIFAEYISYNWTKEFIYFYCLPNKFFLARMADYGVTLKNSICDNNR